MRTSWWILVATSSLFCACGAKWSSSSSSGSGPTPGTAQITGTLPGLSLETEGGVAIARSSLPVLQLKLAPANLTCTSTLDADRLTIDVGAAQPGSFTIVKGYPSSTALASFQARAHACPGGNDAQPGTCFDQVVSGEVTLTRVDDPGGLVEGTFDVVFSQAEITGSFSARRCD